jgi:MoaA/NifB/PqqE/SkfB family radical SAM enzyme
MPEDRQERKLTRAGQAMRTATGPRDHFRLEMIWAEITGECAARCIHCYAGSGPGRGHGVMTAGDWARVIGEAAGLSARRAVFIGGEPALHPGLPGLVRRALDTGMQAEVFSSLVHVPPPLWDVLALPGASLATSWYSADRAQHAAITGRDTWRQVKANIARTVKLGIPLRAGIITGIVPGQNTARAAGVLESLGVPAESITADQMRAFGRGTIADPSQACGHCGRGVAAVLPDGSVTPCPMTRWLKAGSVLDAPLDTILREHMAAASAGIPQPSAACNPKCMPDSYCPPLCTPGACKPRVGRQEGRQEHG